MKPALPLLSVMAILTACAGPPDGEFPSLAKRPYENTPTNNSPNIVVSPQAKTLPAEVAQQVAALEARVEASDAAFYKGLPAARASSQSARGAPRDSETWLAAHVQISRLDRTRTDGLSAIAQMDKMVSERLERELAGETPYYARLMVLRQQRMTAKAQSQNEIIDSLSIAIGL